MRRYENVKVNISEGQKEKIKKAVQSGKSVSVSFSHDDLNGKHLIALTQAQVNKMVKAYQSGTGITIKMSKTQLKKNASVQGGFIGALLPLLATAAKFILPSLATGVLSAVGSKIVDGSGVMYLKKNGMACKVTPAGRGLYLAPWKKGSAIGSGVYLKSGSGYVDGKGILLGPNSPFQNIPILGMIF